MAGHVLVRNVWFLCPCLPCILPSLLGSSLAGDYSALQARPAFFQPQGYGSCTQAWTFPHCLYSVVGAFQLFATSIPPVLDRSWGQNKPDHSCLPAHLFPAPDEWTICWLLIGVGTGVEVSPSTQSWDDPSPLQLAVTPHPKLRGHGRGIRKGSGCLCPIPPTVSNLPLYIHNPLVRHSTLGLVPVALRSPPPLSIWYTHPFRISQEKNTGALCRGRKERTAIKGTLKM